MRVYRTGAGVIALSMALSACSLGGLLGGGGKAPTTLVTLTPEAAAPAQIARSVAAGQAVTIQTPTAGKELTAVRVPVQVTPTDVQYVANLTLVDVPARLFQDLLADHGEMALAIIRELVQRLRATTARM